MVVYKVRNINNEIYKEVDVDVNELKKDLVKNLYSFIQTQLQKMEQNTFKIQAKSLEYSGWSNLHRDNRFASNEINLDVFLSAIDELMILRDDVEFNKGLGFQLSLSKQNYLMVVLENLNFVDKQTRQRIRELINRNMHLSIDEVAQEHMDIALDFRREGAEAFVTLGVLAESQMENIKTDVEKIKNSKDYITCYRGFNTRENEDVRFSTNKNKSDYYKQREGMGFSFTMDKYVAFQFSGFFNLNYIKDADERRKGERLGGVLHYDDTYAELLAKRKGLDLSALGRMTIGRYVIHKDHIMGYNNFSYEREIVCDYRNAKLIDYKFMSDLNQESKNFLSGSIKEYAFHDYTNLKNDTDSWINNNWKNDYRVKKSVESLF